jgi:preprotein translocase subunit SecG
MNILGVVLWILTFCLIVVSIFLVLVVLAQKSKDGGMGATLGGGAVEATFGAEGGNVLTRSTIVAAVAFFILAFAVYLGRIYERKHGADVAGSALPTVSVPVAPKPAATTAAPAPATGVTTAPATAAAPAPSTPAPTTPAPASKP